MNELDVEIKKSLNEKLLSLEKEFEADFLTYYGDFSHVYNSFFFEALGKISRDNKKETIFIILTTTGGDATIVERYVNILRYHYKEVNFIVPDYAYSAGTIFCMSGDKIYMDYISVLGPIDPQVRNKEGKWVAALGYLDKVNEFIKKAENNELTQAEFLILKELDLAELKEHEQAKNLAIDLLKKWLVKYKFKNWNEHRTNPELKGNKVTGEEKKKRAEEIANDLSDNKKWKSHGRPINIEELKKLRLEIEDYSNKETERSLIKDYYSLFMDYVNRNRFDHFIHTKNYF